MIKHLTEDTWWKISFMIFTLYYTRLLVFIYYLNGTSGMNPSHARSAVQMISFVLYELRQANLCLWAFRHDKFLTVHSQPFRGARDLAFCLKVPLDSMLVWASSGGSSETARMRKLTWTFATRICGKYQIHFTRPIYCNDSVQYLDRHVWVNCVEPDRSTLKDSLNLGLHCLPCQLHLLDAIYFM